MQRDLLESELSPDEIRALKNKRTGMLIFQISWIMAFVCMVVVNWQLSYSRDWLPSGAERVNWIPATVASLILLGSMVLARRAEGAIKANNRSGFLSRWIGAIGLGAVFVVIMLVEWFSVQTGSQYVQVFRLMTGFHMFHAVVIGAYMLVVYSNARHNMYGTHDYWAIEAGVKLWYFVFIAWMLFYVVIYWVAW